MHVCVAPQKSLEVRVGTTKDGSPCTILTQNATYVKCMLSTGQFDVVHPMTVWVHARGLARTTATFTYDLVVSSVSREQGSLEGGTELVLRGVGFPIVHDLYGQAVDQVTCWGTFRGNHRALNGFAWCCVLGWASAAVAILYTYPVWVYARIMACNLHITRM